MREALMRFRMRCAHIPVLCRFAKMDDVACGDEYLDNFVYVRYYVHERYYVHTKQGGTIMLSVSATAFRKDLFHLLSNTARYNSEFTVSTKEGNVVVLSEQDYRNLTETVYLSSSPQTKKEIEEGLRAREEDCVPASEVTW